MEAAAGDGWRVLPKEAREVKGRGGAGRPTHCRCAELQTIWRKFLDVATLARIWRYYESEGKKNQSQKCVGP
jgi:hypothetical protein